MSDPLLTFQAMTTADPSLCKLWFGLFGKGYVQGEELLAKGDLQDVLFSAATLGLPYGEPLMISKQAVSSGTYHVYLAPVGQAQVRLTSFLTEQALRSVRTPVQVGLYLPPTLLAQKTIEGILSSALTSALTPASMPLEVYWLKGSFTMNQLLNSVLTVKQDLKQHGLSAIIFH